MRVFLLLCAVGLSSCFSNNLHEVGIVGVYALETWQGVKADGSIVHPYGKDAIGQLMYDIDGNMSMHLMSGTRENLGTDDYDSLDSTAVLNAFKTYFSYYGKYEFDAENGIVTHFIEGCKNPDWKGRELSRRISMNGEELIIRSDSVIGLDHILQWRRVSNH